MLSFFMKKVPLYFVGGRADTMLYLQIFPHLWKLVPNFCGKNYDLPRKTT